MADVNVLMYVESRYMVNRKRIKKAIEETLDAHTVQTKIEVSVAIVGNRKMAALNKKYRGKEGPTNILSFPLAEGEQTPLPNDVIRLGDIVISYPIVIDEAARDEVLVDDHIDMLVKHGLQHLMGMHHD